MKLRITLALIVTILISSCTSQQVSCPTYESDYVYTPRKAAKQHKGKKAKKVVRAEQ